VFPDRAVQQVRVEQAEPDVADILGLRPEEPVLEIERLTFDRTGTPIEWGLISYRYDAIQFHIQLHKDQHESVVNSTVSTTFRQDARPASG
jgi:DNA-binding GntR family transcriptional regulator